MKRSKWQMRKQVEKITPCFDKPPFRFSELSIRTFLLNPVQLLFGPIVKSKIAASFGNSPNI
jgi:hypothetical protein